MIINAPVEKVWSTLTNLNEYGIWNIFITNVQGLFKVGDVLNIQIHLLGKENQKYKVLITEIEEFKKFSWLGHFFITGLIDGTHTFELVKLNDSSTKLIHREKFSGILVPFVWNSVILPRLKPGFIQFNSGFKNHVERHTS